MQTLSISSPHGVTRVAQRKMLLLNLILIELRESIDRFELHLLLQFWLYCCTCSFRSLNSMSMWRNRLMQVLLFRKQCNFISSIRYNQDTWKKCQMLHKTNRTIPLESHVVQKLNKYLSRVASAFPYSVNVSVAFFCLRAWGVVTPHSKSGKIWTPDCIIIVI